MRRGFLPRLSPGRCPTVGDGSRGPGVIGARFDFAPIDYRSPLLSKTTASGAAAASATPARRHLLVRLPLVFRDGMDPPDCPRREAARLSLAEFSSCASCTCP
jgi:hypothetical protein